MKEIVFRTWNLDLFCGLYESYLYNSDTDYYLSELLNDGQNCDISYSWDDFKNVAGESCVSSILNELYNHNVIRDIDYIGIDSPRYYNFDTDRVVMKVHYNFISLIKYCKYKHSENFKKYLKDNFTSYSGFISFITHSFTEFFSKDYFYNELEKCIQVMLEFYLVNEINLGSHMNNMYDDCQEWLLNNVRFLEKQI